MNFSKDLQVLGALAPITSGAAAVSTSAWIDLGGTQPAEGVAFVAYGGTFGTAGVLTLTAFGADATTDAGTTLTGGSVASTQSDRLVVLDVYRPSHRYIKCQVDRASTGCEFGGLVAIKYDMKRVPTTNFSTDVAAQTFVVNTT